MVTSHIKDAGLAGEGERRIEWASLQMPVVSQIRQRFERERPLAGLRIAACLHVTTETAFLAQALKAGGAEVKLCASNPLSTQDEVAAALVVKEDISTFAIKGENDKTYYEHIEACLDGKPQITMDDGADLVSTLHTKKQNLLETVLGGTEETTTGVIRLKAMAKDGVLKYPIIAVNEAMTKHFFDNRYGTGQSTLDGILRVTNRLLAGSNFVIVGYGWCGRGVAARASGHGAHVIICEINPLKALEATMDGYIVMPLLEAAKVGDFFCTVTGNKHVLTKEHFERMKDGVVICNSGHFNVEINLPELEGGSKARRTIRPFVEEFTLKNGRRLYLLAEGRLVNLSCAEGHPSQVMDMSFANQTLCVEYLWKNYRTLKRDVYPVPKAIDTSIARMKLDSMRIQIDNLTAEQKRYLESWEEGT